MVANSTGPAASSRRFCTPLGSGAAAFGAAALAASIICCVCLSSCYGDGTGGIDFRGFLELGQGGVQLASFAEQLSAMHMGGSGEETQALERGPVGKIAGLEVVGLFVIVVGLFVVLSSLGILPFLYRALGLISRDG